MSSLHQSVNWPHIRESQGLKRHSLSIFLDDDKAPEQWLMCYKISKMPKGFKVWLYDFLLEKWGSQQVSELMQYQQRVKVLARQPNVRFEGSVPIRKRNIEILEIMSKFTLLYLGQNGKIFRERFGLSPQDQLKCAIQVYGQCRAMMDQMPKELTLQNADTIANTWFAVTHQTRNKVLVDCGYILKEECIKLTAEDKAFLGLGSSEPTPHLHELDCTGYALLKTRQKSAVGWIKGWITTRQSQDKKRFYETNPITVLQEWGYRVVEHPEEGDLVIYLDTFDRQTKPIARHAGIYQENGTVLSKMNMNYPEIWESAFNANTVNCGNIVVILRKQ